ncbi:hypothetical protein ACFS5N_13070 [Mucilaginibacter ximonensis]|uniref:Uncharacterized protein n=1 Tax=Mucilaginibacter ximonensis TaxID=538021 RepID=A0ABW5YEG7_9SPHI
MENSLKISLLAAAMFAATQTFAQEHKSVGHQIGHAAKDVGHATATAAKDVGHKTAELSSKGAAAVTDKRYEGHWARTGENVYIDEHHKYFYVNKRGHRVFITHAQMRTKPLRH